MTRQILGAMAALGLPFAATLAQAQVLSEQRLLDSNLLSTPGYLRTYQAGFTGDISKGDPAGMIVDLPGLWSLLGQRWTSARDWSGSNALTLKLQNLDSAPARIVIRVEGSADYRTAEQELLVLPGGRTVHLVYDLDLSEVRSWGLKSLPAAYPTEHLHLVSPSTLDLRSIFGWQIYNRGTNQVRIRIWDVKRIRVDASLFGRVDRFGQSTYGNWLGKIGSVRDLAAQRKWEEEDLLAHPGPDGLQGSDALPRQEPSAKWRTLRLPSGKWYLVHPSGRLFWSMGLTTVDVAEGTPLTGRESLFQLLPPDPGSSPHYGTFLYNGQSIQTVNFATSNLELKYGPTWESQFETQALRRLKSWGFNTIGGWSKPGLLTRSDIPFTLDLTTNEFPSRISTPISGRTLPDPFDDAFAAYLSAWLGANIAPYNGRPEFLGVYVDGELPWGGKESARQRDMLAIAVLRAPQNQPARKFLLLTLQKQYRTIERLNQAWGTSFPSWAALGDPGPNVLAAAHADCRQFVSSYAERYFSAIRNAFRQAGCTALYLGSREGWQTTPEVVAAADRFVDVFSMGIYQRPELIDWSFEGIQKPVLISEFSFGATDRGMWNPGPVPSVSQTDRADLMGAFFGQALRTGKVVGANWFQYRDQHVSGRFDGENYNMGFVTVADTPQWEMVAAARALGASLYSIRGQ